VGRRTPASLIVKFREIPTTIKTLQQIQTLIDPSSLRAYLSNTQTRAKGYGDDWKDDDAGRFD